MIMSETDLRISKVLYIGTMNVIVIQGDFFNWASPENVSRLAPPPNLLGLAPP